MDIVLWVLAGVAIGWGSFRLLGYNRNWSVAGSMAVGAGGALVGGMLIGPAVRTSVLESGQFDPFLLVTAAATAASVLLLAAMLAPGGRR